MGTRQVCEVNLLKRKHTISGDHYVKVYRLALTELAEDPVREEMLEKQRTLYGLLCRLEIYKTLTLYICDDWDEMTGTLYDNGLVVRRFDIEDLLRDYWEVRFQIGPIAGYLIRTKRKEARTFGVELELWLGTEIELKYD